MLRSQTNLTPTGALLWPGVLFLDGIDAGAAPTARVALFELVRRQIVFRVVSEIRLRVELDEVV